MREGALVASCHCRRASIRFPRKPDYVNHCNCSVEVRDIDGRSWPQ